MEVLNHRQNFRMKWQKNHKRKKVLYEGLEYIEQRDSRWKVIYCNANASRKKNWRDDTWWLHQPIIDSTRLGINFLNDKVVVLCGTWDCLLDAENFGHFYDKNKMAVSRKSCTTYVNAGRNIKNLLSESEKKSNNRRKRAEWLITASSVGKKWKWEVSRIRPNFCSCKSF